MRISDWSSDVCSSDLPSSPGRTRMKLRHARMLALCLPLLGTVPAAQAFIVHMSTGKPAIYLRVGDGVYSGTYTTNGKPGSGGRINRVSVTVPATELGHGTNLTITSDATETQSSTT